jgi:hypothetical protein
MFDMWRRRGSGRKKARMSHELASGPSSSGNNIPASGRTYYEDFFSDVLDGVLSRKSSLEQRGITVVTTAGALVTLVFTVVSFVLAHVGKGTINPHAIIRGSIELAAVLFVAAAIIGLAINIPVPYGAPHPLDLAGFLYPEALLEGAAAEHKDPDGHESAEGELVALIQQKDHLTEKQELELRSRSRFLTDTADRAAWQVALIRVKLLARARRWNQLKAQLLFLAILSEVGAIGSLAWGIHKLLGL